MNTKLRLLFDECVQEPLARELGRCSGVSDAEHIGVGGLSNKSGIPDNEVIRYADSSKRILVTVETRIDEKTFPICTHPGIIILLAPTNTDKIALFKKLLLSGKRKECDHAVTKLRLTDPIILKKVKNEHVTIPLRLK